MRRRISANRLITGDQDIIDDGAVLIEDDVIVEMGSDEDVSSEDIAVEHSLNDHTLMPGIIDAHTHIASNGNPNVVEDELGRSLSQRTIDAIQNAKTTVEAGITTIRDVGSPSDIAMTVRDAIEQGSFPGPRIVACGQGLSATGGHGIVTPWYLERGADDGMAREANGVSDVRNAVREQVRKEADAIKVWATGGVIDPEGEIETVEFSPEELTAIVEEANRHNLHVASHAHPPNGILTSVEAGVRSVEHGMYMDAESMDAMAENDVYLVLTMAVMQTIIQSDSVPEYYRTNTEEAVEYRRSKLSEAKERGVKFAMGTDAGAPTMHHGENTLELECMVDADLDPLEAIEISTRQTAEMLGLQDVGVLGTGNQADLIAIRGDPLEDITVIRDQTNVELVTVGGRVAKDETEA